jgi:hypothetical protein
MKDIRKYVTGLAAAGLVMTIAGISQAFTSITANTYTATVSVTGGATNMSIALLNLSGGAASSIGWTAAAGTGWTLANQYLQITSHLSQNNGAFIQTYTNNTAGVSPYNYTGVISSVTASPAGLVDASNTAYATLPIAWQISASISPTAVNDPNCTGVSTATVCTGPQTGWAWNYYEDKAQVANNQGVTGPFVNGAQAVTVEEVPGYIQYAQSSFGPGGTGGVNNLFLEANFLNALGGTTYGTNTLTVELATP